ncbi:hypothetical protein AB7M17_003957 [Bradyrhizobium sp. USDA 377]
MTEFRKPFMPPSRTDLAREWHRSFIRAATARVLSRVQKTSVEAVLRDAGWQHDNLTGLILRAAVEPLKQADLPGDSVAALLLLAPDSEFAEILNLADRINLRGLSQFSLVSPTSFSEAVFVEEGFPIPAAQGVFEGQLIGPVKKLALLAPLTNELENLSAPDASVVISRLLKQAVGKGGAKVLLSADPPTAASPGGILYGIPPLAAGASASDDIKALLAEIAANGISTRSVVLIVASDLFGVFETLPWPNFKRTVIEAPTLAPGTAIALATDGFVVSGDGIPEVDSSRQATLHLADPAEQIGTPGTSPDPAVIAAPSVSMFQTDSFALRCISRVTWSAAPGSVAWIEGATW